MNICIICEYGWIIIGHKENENESTESDLIKLHDASVVRCWNNGKGIGGIAKAENAGEYILDAIGDVNIRKNKVLFEIPCNW